jgi:hypothetical protein
MRRRKNGTADENGSPSSDDTWNSHNHQFVKTLCFADGRLLKGATPERGECDMEDEQLDSSSGKGAVNPCFTLLTSLALIYYILLEKNLFKRHGKHNAYT